MKSVKYASRQLLKERVVVPGGAGAFASPPFFYNCAINSGKSSHFPHEHESRHLPSDGTLKAAGQECIFVCCFITCSCFIDGDLKAARPLYDVDGEGPSSASGDIAWYEVSGSGPIKVSFQVLGLSRTQRRLRTENTMGLLVVVAAGKEVDDGRNEVRNK